MSEQYREITESHAASAEKDSQKQPGGGVETTEPPIAPEVQTSRDVTQERAEAARRYDEFPAGC